jgi:hypothetical protein
MRELPVYVKKLEFLESFSSFNFHIYLNAEVF